MSRQNKTHLLHVRSSVVENGNPKLPQPEDISYGELAINYAKDNEVLSIKNSQNEIVPLFFGGSIKEIHVNGVEADIENRIATIEISGSDENVGEYTSVEYPSDFSGATNVSGDQTIAEAFKSVETTISSLTQEVLDDEVVTEKAIKALGNAAGTIDNNNIIKYVVNENANYIKVATSLADADNILDSVIKNVDDGVNGLNDRINDLEDTIITSITVNDVDATIAQQKATVVISGSDTNVGTYTSVQYPTEFSAATPVSGSQTIANAFNSVETTVSALTQEVINNEKVISNAIATMADSAGLINDNDEISYNVNERANYINTATSLADADNILDSAIKYVDDGVNGLNDRINDLEDTIITSITVNNVNATIANNIASVIISGSDENVGTYTSVEYPTELSAATNVSGSQTVAQAFNAVETTISALTQEVLDNELVTEKAIKALGNAAGTIDENDAITYVVNENANYINVATSLADADDILDAAIKSVDAKIDGLSGLTNLTVNGVNATITDGVANVSISGHNETVGNYNSVQYPSEFTAATPVSGTQTIAQAFNSVETTLSGLSKNVIDNDKKVSNTVTSIANAAGLVVSNDTVSYDANESANYINTATSLANADDILDAAIKNLADNSIENVYLNNVAGVKNNKNVYLTISGSNENVGTYTSVQYPTELSGASNVSGSQTIAQAFNSVETTVSALTKDVTSAITSIAQAAGLNDANNIVSYDANENANYIRLAASLADADNILDTTIKSVADDVDELNGKILTSITVNGVNATIANQSASVTISGQNISVGTYTTVAYPQELSGAVNVSGSQTIPQALNAIETTVSALTEEVIHNEETDANAIFDLADAVGNVVDTTTGQIKFIPILTDPILNQAQSYYEIILLLSEEIQELKNRVTVLEGRI